MDRVALRLCILPLLLSTFVLSQAFNSVKYGTPAQSGDLAVADFNRDGKPDIVTTEETSNKVTVFINNGSGQFQSGGTNEFLVASAGVSPRRVVAADFDGDGNADIVTANCTQAISALYGYGNGTFEGFKSWPIPGTTCPTSLAIIYLPGDSRPDLVITRDIAVNNDGLVLLENKGKGLWQIAYSTTVAGAVRMFNASAADYDKDGISDVAVVTETASGFDVVNVISPFTMKTVRNVTSFEKAEGANTVDFGNDGVPDLIVPFSTSSTSASGANALSNDGLGHFASQQLNLLDQWTSTGWKAAEGDFNLDEFEDIFVGTMRQSGGNAFAVFLATGKGFWGMTYYGPPVEGTPGASVSADFNADGKTDVALLSSPNSLYVYTNATSGGPSECVPEGIGVKICTPAAGSNVSSPVQISATASGTGVIIAMKAYLDGQQVASSTSASLKGSVAATAGLHNLTVNAWDTGGKVYQSKMSFTVGSGSGTGCNTSTVGVVICSPANGATVNSSFKITAAAQGASTIIAMKAYVDGIRVAAAASGSLDAPATANPGAHNLTVNAWDSLGNLYQAKSTFSVGGCALPAANQSISICSPASGATVNSPVAISTRARWDGQSITFSRVYIDNTKRCESPGSSVSCSVTLSPGAHNMSVVTWISTGAYLKTTRSFTIQ
jgi:hypothetical protein